MKTVIVTLILLTDSVMGFVSNSEDLEKLLKMETDLVEELKNHSLQLEQALNYIQEYVVQVKEVYGSSCPDGECSEEMMEDKIIGNPILNYQLLKRMTVKWAKLEKTIMKIDGIGTMSKIKKIRESSIGRKGRLPTEEDLQDAAKTINKLQDVYHLDPAELVKGNIGGVQTSSRLGAEDSYYLARFAAMEDQPDVAAGLVEEALLQVINSNKSISSISKENNAQIQGMQQLRRQQTKKTSDSPRKEENFVLGKIPPRTQNPRNMIIEQDRINFKALCRGKDLLPPSTRSRLFCYWSTRGDDYYLLHPLAVEELHPAPNQILMFHHVLSDSQCDQLTQFSNSRMKRAAIGKDKQLSETRVASNTWIEDNVHPSVDKLSRISNLVTGLQTSKLYDVHGEGKKEEYEFLQIARYGLGGHYDVHQDPLFVYKEPDFIARSIEAVGADSYPTGDRMSTLMYYLSNVDKGGLTAFPRLGVASTPSKGAAIFWHNIKRSGRSDMAMLHGGCPVLLGSKVVANKWIREVANVFHRKCLDLIDI